MKGRRSLAIAAIALVYAGSATPQSVYKSVDAQGRVTYSSSPPPDVAGEMVEQVPIAPSPTDQQQQTAAQRAKALGAATQQAQQQRREQAAKAAQARSDAKRELRKAEITLQEARTKGDSDWQYLSTGGRVLKQSYLDRVKDAERKVEQATRAVREAGSTQR